MVFMCAGLEDVAADGAAAAAAVQLGRAGTDVRAFAVDATPCAAGSLSGARNTEGQTGHEREQEKVLSHRNLP